MDKKPYKTVVRRISEDADRAIKDIRNSFVREKGVLISYAEASKMLSKKSLMKATGIRKEDLISF